MTAVDTHDQLLDLAAEYIMRAVKIEDDSVAERSNKVSAKMQMTFGATDQPNCTECESRMWLTRRGPHPVHGFDFELQTFTCRGCNHEMQRTANSRGNVMI